MNKTFFLLGAISIMSVFSSAYCMPTFDDVALARQCHVLSQNLEKLANVQTDIQCSVHIGIASSSTELSGKYIINQEYSYAKYVLNEAISELKYAEVIDCISSTEVSILKNESISINKRINA
jgi:hypothetical protein